MAISRVWIEDGCLSCGVAESICPEVFKVVDENTVIEGVDLSKFEAKIKEAAESCPGYSAEEEECGRGHPLSSSEGCPYSPLRLFDPIYARGGIVDELLAIGV